MKKPITFLLLFLLLFFIVPTVFACVNLVDDGDDKTTEGSIDFSGVTYTDLCSGGWNYEISCSAEGWQYDISYCFSDCDSSGTFCQASSTTVSLSSIISAISSGISPAEVLSLITGWI